MRTGGVILAAGLSSRMGDFKPLLRLGGHTLVEHCTRSLRSAGVTDIVLVTGHKQEELIPVAEKLELSVTHNTNFQEGMFSSVRAGVQFLSPQISSFFLLPVDIPLVRVATIRTLLGHEKADGSAVLIPCFKGQQGHPPLIPGSIIPQILDYNGAGGLQALLRDCSGREIEVWDRFILKDADTTHDFSGLQRMFARHTIPTPDETEALLLELVPDAGQPHGRLVGKAAVAIGREMNNCGFNFDLDLLYAGGCLHDLAKGEPDHALTAAEKLKDLDLQDVAETVAHHSSLPLPKDGRLEERHLVCLTDKAVSNRDIIEPEQRYLAKLTEYKNDAAACQTIRQRMKEGLSLQHHVEKQCGKPLLAIISGRTG